MPCKIEFTFSAKPLSEDIIEKFMEAKKVRWKKVNDDQ